MSKRVKIVDVQEFSTGVYRCSIKLECGHLILRESSPRNPKYVNGCAACDEEREWEMALKAREIVRARKGTPT